MQTKKGGGGGGLNFEFLCFDRPKFSEFLLFSVRKICKKMKRFSPRLSWRKMCWKEEFFHPSYFLQKKVAHTFPPPPKKKSFFWISVLVSCMGEWVRYAAPPRKVGGDKGNHKRNRRWDLTDKTSLPLFFLVTPLNSFWASKRARRDPLPIISGCTWWPLHHR